MVGGKKLLRALWRAALIGVAWVAGCHVPVWVPAYGAVPLYGMPPTPHDPTVQITDFSYEPASPVRIGDTLTFTTTLNHATNGAYLQVVIGEPPVNFAMLNDYGIAADAHAYDGIYSGLLEWTPAFGPIANEPMVVHLSWEDGAPGLELAGPPLTVEE